MPLTTIQGLRTALTNLGFEARPLLGSRFALMVRNEPYRHVLVRHQATGPLINGEVAHAVAASGHTEQELDTAQG